MTVQEPLSLTSKILRLLQIGLLRRKRNLIRKCSKEIIALLFVKVFWLITN